MLLSGVGTRRLRGKLADFGIALLRAGAGRPEEQTTGTAAYLSPEQVEGVPLTPATDVYSLGLVLLEGLTGAPGVHGHGARGRARAASSGSRRSPTTCPTGWA